MAIDAPATILPSFLQLWFIIPIMLMFVAINIKSHKGKGALGESFVNNTANYHLDKDEYHLIKNVTLPTEDGTTQVDHIIVSKYGIFVIETKNMKGWIFGNEKNKIWTQSIFGHKTKFQNPLHQNYKHIKTIENILNIEIEKIFSIIVFAGESTFKTEMPANVLHGSDYIYYIKSKTERILSNSEVAIARSLIKAERLPDSYKTNREHIEHVKRIIKEKDQQYLSTL